MKCPTCKNILGNKQIYYEQNLDKICKDQEMNKITDDEAEKRKIELVNFLIPNKHRYCCKMRLMTYKRLIEIVK
jgi:DNA-directed RNA polymerase subunit N (RpoN/RPB10)